MEGSGRRWSIKQDYCRKARSATEGFISVANNLRGFGLSLYSGIDKVLQLYKAGYQRWINAARIW